MAEERPLWTRIVQSVPTDRPVSISEVAIKNGVSLETARRALVNAADGIELEVYERCSGAGARFKTRYFRRYVEGETRALYQPRPGVDAKLLASCWGGYTYPNQGVSHVLCK